MSTIFERFKQIEHNFNNNFLLFINSLVTTFPVETKAETTQIEEIKESTPEVKDEETLEAEAYLAEQSQLLLQAYSHWYEVLQNDPKSLTACDQFYAAVDPHLALLKNRDTQLFTVHGDLLANILGQPGLDTEFLFIQFGDPTEDDPADYKAQFWTTLVKLHQLGVLICVYLKMPLVKDIIDIVIGKNPDLNKSNVLKKIFKEFQSERSLRRKIMKLSQEDNFDQIRENLQKVMATFSDASFSSGAATGGDDSNNPLGAMGSMMSSLTSGDSNAMAGQLTKLLHPFLTKADLMPDPEPEAEVMQKLWGYLQTDDPALKDEAWNDGLSEVWSDRQQMDQAYEQSELKQSDIAKTVSRLGSMLDKMMLAVKGTEEEREQLFKDNQDLFGDLGLSPDMFMAEMKKFEEEEDLNPEVETKEEKKNHLKII